MIYIIGNGSFAAELAEYALDADLCVSCVEVGRTPTGGLALDDLAGPPELGASCVIGVGSNRHELARGLADLGWKFATIVHPKAHLAHSASFGPGTVIAPGVVIGAQTVVGANSMVSRGVLVGHHARIGDRVVLNPGANVAGNCTLGDDVFVGMGACVLNGLEVGAGAIVAAGAVVTRDVRVSERVQGVPARSYPGLSDSAVRQP